VKEIRGQGLMIGIELDRPCGVLLQRAPTPA
jgi:acetylornithine/N-succinyldiaminopimelate aminotransferase